MHRKPSEQRSSSVASSVFFARENTIQMKSRLRISKHSQHPKNTPFPEHFTAPFLDTFTAPKTSSVHFPNIFTAPLAEKHHDAPTNTSLPASNIDGHSVATFFRSAINKLSVCLCDASESQSYCRFCVQGCERSGSVHFDTNTRDACRSHDIRSARV